MKLLTQELIKKIPPLYGQEGKGKNALAYVKLFTPDSNFNWYIPELDSEEGLCFGLIDGLEKELGYFSLNEIEQIKGPMGLEVERDVSFQPTKLKNLGFDDGE
jgi:hypothetical protein